MGAVIRDQGGLALGGCHSRLLRLFRVWGFGLRVSDEGFGFWVWGFGFEVWSFGFGVRAWVLGFGFWFLGFGI